MDLENERSALESVENNEVITPQRSANVDGTKIASNGSCGGEFNGNDDNSVDDSKAKDVRVAESLNSPRSTSNSPRSTGYSLSVGSSPQATKKGYGLKKWRRIRREFSKDGSSSVDTSKILKRGLSTSMVNLSKPQGVSIETRQKSDGSSSSTNAVMKSLSVAADGTVVHGANLDSRLVGPSFAAGTDSDNSEDRSSRSSTAASVPKNRMRTLSGKNMVPSVQRSQPGKSRIDTGKKHRGERVKVEKENSQSSMESDSRSSNVVFMQGTTSVTSNGRHSGKSMNYDAANSDEAQDGEQHFGEEQTCYNKENDGEFETLSQEDLAADLSWEVREDKVENHGSSTDPDPLVESIHTLQSAQEQLEKEIQKLREIGTEPASNFEDSTMETTLPSEFASGFSETEVVSLKQNMNLLESKLEEANAELRVKEAKVIELESVLKSNESPNHIEMEAELEGLFKQKIEAEVEYLAISRTIEKLRADAVDHFALFKEQKTLASEQAQVLDELGDVESKAAKLKTQAEKLETKYEDVVLTEEVLRLQNRVCQVTSCLFMQLILLVLVFVFFLLQLSPHYEGVVPT